MKHLSVIIGLLLFSSVASAFYQNNANACYSFSNQSYYTIGGGTGFDQISSTTNYRYHGPYNPNSDSSIEDAEQVIPHDGKIMDLNVRLHDTAGGGNLGQWTFVLMINGDDSVSFSPTGDTDLECTISDTGESCSDNVNKVVFKKGDKIALMSVPSCKNPNLWGPSTNDCPVPRQMRWTARVKSCVPFY